MLKCSSNLSLTPASRADELPASGRTDGRAPRTPRVSARACPTTDLAARPLSSPCLTSRRLRRRRRCLTRPSATGRWSRCPFPLRGKLVHAGEGVVLAKRATDQLTLALTPPHLALPSASVTPTPGRHPSPRFRPVDTRGTPALSPSGPLLQAQLAELDHARSPPFEATPRSLDQASQIVYQARTHSRASCKPLRPFRPQALIATPSKSSSSSASRQHPGRRRCLPQRLQRSEPDTDVRQPMGTASSGPRPRSASPRRHRLHPPRSDRTRSPPSLARCRADL
jgi:hypothetical protein